MIEKRQRIDDLRTELERRVIDSLDNYFYDPALGNPRIYQMNEKYFRFEDHWKKLVDYYEEHEDAVIGLKLVSLYLEVSEILSVIARSQDMSTERRASARDMLDNVEYDWSQLEKVAVDLNEDDTGLEQQHKSI